MVKAREFITANKSASGKTNKWFFILPKEAVSTISSPPLPVVGQIWKPSQENIKAMYDKFDILRTVTIWAIDKTSHIQTVKGLRSGEIFFLYMVLSVARFPFEFLTQNFFDITQLAPAEVNPNM